jgi:uncharacterized protein (DUF1501 family)
MDRRRFLQLVSATPMALWAAPSWAGEAVDPWTRTLVLVQLAGGNDGLNTVVPFADPAYLEARKKVTVPVKKLHHLDDSYGLHPKLVPLAYAWDAKELAVVHGVGYPGGPMGHYAASESLDTGALRPGPDTRGWIPEVLAGVSAPRGFAQAADLAVTGPGADLGAGLSLRIPPDGGPKVARPASRNKALDHVVGLHAERRTMARDLWLRAQDAGDLGTRFPATSIGEQFGLAARLLSSGAPVAVMRLEQTGYDTHRDQTNRQARLLGELGAAIGSFRSVLLKSNRWRNVMVVVVSEFGRTLAENAAGGTEDGTAGVAFALGGAVKGGMYGTPPRLGDLVDGHIGHTVDFRSLYGTIASGFWGVEKHSFSGFPRLGFL